MLERSGSTLPEEVFEEKKKKSYTLFNYSINQRRRKGVYDLKIWGEVSLGMLDFHSPVPYVF